VSKTWPARCVAEAFEAGQLAFGENTNRKRPASWPNSPTCRSNGTSSARFRANKTRPIAEQFAWVHSVDRDKIARRLSEQRPAHLEPLKRLRAGERQRRDEQERGRTRCSTRAGSPRGRTAAASSARADGGAGAHRGSGAAARAIPQAAAPLRRDPAAGIALDTLSMGMSDDLEAAILEGATIVRVGTAIFGRRTTPDAAPG